MANTIPTELQKLFNGTRPGQSPIPQMPTSAPLPVPTMGPTIANAAALPQAPSPAGAFDPSQFFGGRDAGNTIGLPDVAAAGQIRQPEQAPNALLDLAEREGALGPKMSDIFSGRETAISEGGVAAPIASPVTPTELGGIPSGLGGEDVFGSTPAPTPSAGVSPTALGAPTSGSGIGTSVVNDVNFLQEGMKQMQAPQPQGLTTAGGQPLAEFLAGGQQLDPQGRMIDPNVDRSFFEQQSAERNERALAEFGQARGPDSTDRAAGEMTTADAKDLAALRDPRASASEKARGRVVAERNGLDPLTGAEKTSTSGGMTRSEDLAERKFQHQKNVDAYNAGQDDLVRQGKAVEAFEQDEAMLRSVSGDAGRIGNLVNEAVGLTTEAGTTGLAGSILKHIPSSNANQLKSVLEVVSSKVALDRLTELKSTGATLGQVSEKELKMLQDSYDALGQNLKPERLRESLVNYATALKAVEDKVAAKFVEKHGQGKFDKIMGGGTSAGGGIPNDRNATSSGDALVNKYNA